jgi:inner membrane protein
MWGVRDYEHRRALNALAARSYENADPLRVSAYPAMIDPFHWYGVVETSSFFALAPVNSLEPEVDPEGRLDIHYKPEETPVTLAAKNSYLGRVYLSWAQYPITETEALPTPDERYDGYIVHFQDLRFLQMPSAFSREARPRRGPLGASVRLDKNLNVVGDVYGSGKNEVIVPEPGQDKK